MKILKRIGVAVFGLAALLALLAFLLPDHAFVERSIDIQAPACTIFAQVDNFKAFNAWSPWAKLDPNTVYTYDGPDEGVGATLRWSSEASNVGSGTQKITASTPCAEVDTDLNFSDGGPATTTMTLVEGPEGVHVRWTLDAPFGGDLVGRYFGLMFDRMIGPDYERGLANLKAIAEALPKTDFAGLSVERLDLSGRTIAFVSRESSADPFAFASELGGAYHDLSAWLAQNHLSTTGPPVVLFRRWDDSGRAFDAGLPVVVSAASPPAMGGPIQLAATPSGRAARVVHTGPTSGLSHTHDQLVAWVAAHGLKENSPYWAEYVSDPTTTPAESLVTNLCVLVR